MTDNYQEMILLNDEFYKHLIQDIEAAKRSIDLETYIFANDAIGRKVIDALCRAASRNVTIRVLIDGIGSLSFADDVSTQLESANIATRIFHPIPWYLTHWRRAANAPISSMLSKALHLFITLNARNHRKVCIIDRHIVYVGSANIIKNHLLKNQGGDNWHDISVRLEGLNSEDLQYAFEKAWNHIPFRKRLRAALRIIYKNPIFRLNYSWKRRHILNKNLLKRLSKCQKRIWVMNAYFLPSPFFIKRLIRASRRGVDVKILLPYNSDIFISTLLSETFYAELLKAGILIYRYKPSVLHAKVMILDNWYCVGSSNLNTRSWKHDLEVDVNIRSSDSKKMIEHCFINDLNQSVQLTLNDILNQPWYKRVVQRVLLLLRYWF